MTTDISGQGLEFTIIASNTFPNGVTLTQFADDADPLDMPDLKIADVTMGLNGDLISWSTAVPILSTIALVPGSDDDKNMAILAEANRSGRGKINAKDIITGIVSSPDGKIITFSEGKMLTAPPADSVASAGRKKSKVYGFGFENKVETGGLSISIGISA